MQSGDFNWIKFGGVKNPRSMLSSDVFNLETYDGEDPPNLIAKGPIDIIRMTEMSKFDVFEILIDNPINGAQSTYTISFEAKTPIRDGDIFNLLLPTSIKSPKEPICNTENNCLDSISCTSERGKLIATFGVTRSICMQDDAEISFSVEDMTNAPSTLPSESIEAFWTSSNYMDVCEYQGDPDVPYTIKNTISGTIDPNTVAINQDSEDYGINNQYTIRFSPTNPIPKLGWITLKYPDNVKIIDSENGVNDMDTFMNGAEAAGGFPTKLPIEAYTSNSYQGENYAFVDEAQRTMYFHSAFME